MMTDLDRTADFLLTNRSQQRLVDNIPQSLYPKSTDAAYQAQDRLVSRLTERYRSRTCGYKLACTNRMAMTLLGVDAPFSGRLLSHSTHDSGVVLKAGDFVRRLVEVEFVFIPDRDVPAASEPYTAQTILPFIGEFVPGIEIVDHRYADFTRVGGNALIADNAIHGASVLGKSGARWRSMDLSRHGVSLMVNGGTRFRGGGENVLDGPLNAMAWLANHLHTRGRGLKAGDIVTTGTACDIHEAVAGDNITADFGELGSVQVSFV